MAVPEVPFRRPRDLVVAYPAERDLPVWERRHAAGEVPGRWPYGLHALGEQGHRLRTLELGPGSRVGRVLNRIRETTSSGRPVPTGGGALAGTTLLTWDEAAAVRAVGHRAALAHHSGVIWLTDRPEGRAAQAARRALDYCAGLWTLSTAQVQPLTELMGPGGPSVAPVVFGIDSEFFSRHDYPERPLVVSVGGDRDRDPTTLFAALARVNRARPEVEIVVQSRTNTAAPTGVTVVPHLTHVQLRALYRRMSVMVLATRPNLHVSGMTVSLESRATGRPVVITGTPGMEAYVGDDDSVVVPTGDAPALGDAVIALLDDPDRAAAMGRAGRSRVERAHTESSMCEQIMALVQG